MRGVKCWAEAKGCPWPLRVTPQARACPVSPELAQAASCREGRVPVRSARQEEPSSYPSFWKGGGTQAAAPGLWSDRVNAQPGGRGNPARTRASSTDAGASPPLIRPPPLPLSLLSCLQPI